MPLHKPHALSIILRRERQRAHMTVRQLAENAGVAPSSVSRIESGSIALPTPDLLQRLARALRIDVEELYEPAGYLAPTGLLALRPYLRAKYGLADDAASRIEGYVQALCDQTELKEVRHEGDQAR